MSKMALQIESFARRLGDSALYGSSNKRNPMGADLAAVVRRVWSVSQMLKGIDQVAKPNYQFEKRQREQEKKKKKAEKAQRKATAIEEFPSNPVPQAVPENKSEG